jgi:hypothetical protein
MSNSASDFQAPARANNSMIAPTGHRLPIAATGMSLGLFISITYVLSVLFDLWLPQFAMNSTWAPLLPGFTWTSFLIGLVETFAYGWYVALLFVPLFNFFAYRSENRSGARRGS